MNDELITRLRAEATMWNSFRGPSPTKEVLTAAADALEAAQAEATENRIRRQIIDTAYKQIKGLEAERDAAQAEAKVWMNAVADAVEPMGFDREAACGPADLIPGLRWLVENEAKARAERDAEAALADSLAEALGTERDTHQCNSAFTADALAAHRERRTTPTKENE